MKKIIVGVLIGGGVLAAIIGLVPDIIRGLTNEPPQLSVELSATTGDAPLKVVANANPFDPDNDDIKISWYLDNQLQTEGNLNTYDFDFPTPGQYEIKVLASDGNKSVQKKQLIIVKAPVKKISAVSLDAPLIIEDPASDYEFTGEVITNGFDVSLKVNNLIGGSAQIRAFPPGRAPSGGNGSNGGNGRHGNGGSGQAGGNGGNGNNGVLGQTGKSAGNIRVIANDISANIIISNRGQNGGNGGRGGNGGNAGNGGQGSPSSAGFSIGGVGDCRSGPGRGGNGGNGGDGGAGGNAGNGGNGGAVFIETKSITGSVTITTKGGLPGSSGSGGRGGNAGLGGAEGALNGTCGSAGRIGSNGSPGNAGSLGNDGSNGDDGDIEVIVDGLVKISPEGEFTSKN